MSNPSTDQPVDPEQLHQYYQNIVNRLQQITNQENQFSNVVAELNHSLETLKGLKKYPNDSEVILPLGGLLFIKAKLTNSNEILLDVGSGSYVPTGFDEATNTLTKKLKEMSDFLQKIVEEKSSLEKEAKGLQSYFNENKRG